MRFTKDNDMKLDTKALQELKERVMRLDFQMRIPEVVLGMTCTCIQPEKYKLTWIQTTDLLYFECCVNN